MKKRVKIISVIIIVLLLVAVSVVSILQPLKVETKTLSLGDSEIFFTETGIVTDSSERYIYPLVSGELLAINVAEGDHVKVGDVLGVIDSTAIDYEIINLENTVAGYEAQLVNVDVENQANIDALNANKNNLLSQLDALDAETNIDGQVELQQLIVDKSKAIYDKGVEDLGKYSLLLEEGIIAESEYEAMEALVNSYEVSYNQSVVQLEALNNSTLNGDYYEAMKASINAQIEGINISLSRDNISATKAYYEALIEGAKAGVEALKVQKENYNIISTVEGVVDEVNIENTNMVTGLEPAFVVNGTGNTEIEVMINTRDIEVVMVGDEVQLTLDRRTGDIELIGIITEIADKASMEYSALGVEERKVKVTIEPEDLTNLKTGYDVDVKFIVHSEQGKIIVPNSALYKEEGKDMILIIEAGKVKDVEVVLGYELTGETVIEEGLKEGDQIITDIDADGIDVGKRAESSNSE